MKKIISGVLLISTIVMAQGSTICVDSIIENKITSGSFTRNGTEPYINIQVCIHSSNTLNSTELIETQNTILRNIALVDKQKHSFSSSSAHEMLVNIRGMATYTLTGISIK